MDFIIYSIDYILRKEFGRSLSDENIHILDPFTGTGTFITRLLQSGLIDPKDLPRKYKHELHANEIVLLAYYIAAVNIENAYYDQMGEASQYEPFEGIVLTDTFQMGETDVSERLSFSEMFQRQEAARGRPLPVIRGRDPPLLHPGLSGPRRARESFQVRSSARPPRLFLRPSKLHERGNVP